MQDNKEKVIKEFLSKLKENKELSEKLQTKILSLKDIQSETKARTLFLKELESASKILDYNLSRDDFENYFNSQNVELSDDVLEQASGGRGNFWSWVAVGLGTVAGGIGMIAGALGGSSGNREAAKNDNRPAYVQSVDQNKNRSHSFDANKSKDNGGTKELKQQRNANETNKNTPSSDKSTRQNRFYTGKNAKKGVIRPGKIARRNNTTTPDRNLRFSDKKITKAKAPEKGGEAFLKDAFKLKTLENHENQDVVNKIKKLVKKEKENRTRRP